MSIHPSLRGVNNLVGERSVFTRMERIQILARDGRFDKESSSPHGLPKVRTRGKVAKKKSAKAEEKAEAKAEPAK